jgi:hypothetical protein
VLFGPGGSIRAGLQRSREASDDVDHHVTETDDVR